MDNLLKNYNDPKILFMFKEMDDNDCNTKNFIFGPLDKEFTGDDFGPVIKLFFLWYTEGVQKYMKDQDSESVKLKKLKNEAAVRLFGMFLRYIGLKNLKDYDSDISINKINTLSKTVFFKNMILPLFDLVYDTKTSPILYIKELFYKYASITLAEKKGSNGTIYNIEKNNSKILK